MAGKRSLTSNTPSQAALRNLNPPAGTKNLTFQGGTFGLKDGSFEGQESSLSHLGFNQEAVRY